MRMKSFLLSLSTIAALGAGAAHASTNLVANGSFDSTTNGTNKQLASSVTTASNRTTATDWTSSNGNDGGYNFILASKIATTWDSALWLNGNANGFTASPDGGNFLASDQLYYPGTISQSISGLTVGDKYTLTFDYALAQQVGFNGANPDNYWQVGFGSTVKDTSLLSISSGGFSGWKTASMTFTAASTTELLSFLAKGTPTGAPPFLLLDGVSMVAAVPEPATWAMLLGGVGLIGFMARRRKAAAATPA